MAFNNVNNIKSSGLQLLDTSATFTGLSYTAGTSWDPTLTFTGGNTGMTFGTKSAYYTLVDKVLIFNIAIVLTAKGSSTGNALISNFPVANGANGSYITIPVSYWGNFSFAGGYTMMSLGSNGNNTTQYGLYQSGAGVSPNNINSGHFTDTSTFYTAGMYTIA